MPKKAELTRECCLTRETKPVAELLRFALGPDNVLVPDVDAKAPGRGVWITLSEVMVAEAVQKKAFARGLKQAVEMPPDLAQLARRRLEERLLGAFGLARKAGQLVTGAAKVEAAISGKTITALFTASDAAEDGRRKMRNALYARYPDSGVPHYDLLQSRQMGLALGLENVIHAALVEGAAAHAALARAKRLALYRAANGKEDKSL